MHGHLNVKFYFIVFQNFRNVILENMSLQKEDTLNISNSQ